MIVGSWKSGVYALSPLLPTACLKEDEDSEASLVGFPRYTQAVGEITKL